MPDWKKIKAEYIRGDTSYRKLADKYGVSFSTLQKVGAEEKWTDLRKKSKRKAEEKIVESVASQEAKRVDAFTTLADKLLKMISDGVDNGSIVVTARGLRDITGAIKDLREIKGIKSDLDFEEQKARIEKLKKDATTETKDRTIEVVIGKGLEDFCV